MSSFHTQFEHGQLDDDDGTYTRYRILKGKGICLGSRYPCDDTCSSDFTLLRQWAHSSLQLLIQPWICAPGTHYGWVDRQCILLVFIAKVQSSKVIFLCFVFTLNKKATINQVTTKPATSNNVLFPGHSPLLTTSTDDLTLWIFWLPPLICLGQVGLRSLSALVNCSESNPQTSLFLAH